jgi:hypothetical protein
MDTTTIVGIGVFAGYLLLCACCGIYVATQKGRSETEGFIFGLLLGPVGVLVIACLPVGLMRAGEDEEDQAVRQRVASLGATGGRPTHDQAVRKVTSTEESKRAARLLLGEVDE